MRLVGKVEVWANGGDIYVGREIVLKAEEKAENEIVAAVVKRLGERHDK
jgi:hypothetical protein